MLNAAHMRDWCLVLRLTTNTDGTSRRAERAGVHLGDRLTHVNGEICHADHAVKLVAAATYPMTLTLLRADMSSWKKLQSRKGALDAFSGKRGTLAEGMKKAAESKQADINADTNADTNGGESGGATTSGEAKAKAEANKATAQRREREQAFFKEQREKSDRAETDRRANLDPIERAEEDRHRAHDEAKSAMLEKQMGGFAAKKTKAKGSSSGGDGGNKKNKNPNPFLAKGGRGRGRGKGGKKKAAQAQKESGDWSTFG